MFTRTMNNVVIFNSLIIFYFFLIIIIIMVVPLGLSDDTLTVIIIKNLAQKQLQVILFLLLSRVEACAMSQSEGENILL